MKQVPDGALMDQPDSQRKIKQNYRGVYSY